MKKHLLALAFSSVMLSSSAMALDIVITNDDSYTTANVQQLKVALENAGHNVIVSVPCAHQSGTGGNLGSYLTPVPIHKLTSNNDILSIDDNTTNPAGYCVGDSEEDKATKTFKEYKNGSPLMASAYGVFKANKVWGKNPDLVISGPNEGRNVGFAVFVSGTLGATHEAIVNGIPAIAVSAGSTPKDATEAKTYAQLVASKVVAIVAQLEKSKKSGEAILPLKMGLNVNLPDDGVLAADTAYKMTKVDWAFGLNVQWANLGEGYGGYYGYKTSDNLYGLNFLPGDSPVGDTNELSEGIAATKYIAISPIDATENAPRAKEDYTKYRLNTLVK